MPPFEAWCVQAAEPLAISRKSESDAWSLAARQMCCRPAVLVEMGYTCVRVTVTPHTAQGEG